MRTRLTAAVATVAVVALSVGVSRLGGTDEAPPVANGQVSRPPADAGPADVVRAYVAALDAGDIATAKTLATPEYAASVERMEDSWYRNVVSIRDVHVDPAVPETDGTHGVRYAEVVFVPVSFVLRQREEASMPDGETVWGYLLARATPNDRWLIFDEGPV